MKNNKKHHIGIRHEDTALNNKLHFIARYEGRSVNQHILFLLRRDIERFEKEHGKIPAPKQGEA